jgi:hypothetical protein
MALQKCTRICFQEPDPPRWGFITALIIQNKHTQIPQNKIRLIDNTLTTKEKKKEKRKAGCNLEKLIVLSYNLNCRSRDSSVGIATGYGLDDRGVRVSPGKVKNFLLSTSSRMALGPTQPPIEWVPGVKRPKGEADHSLQNSTEIKITWIYTATPPYAFMT